MHGVEFGAGTVFAGYRIERLLGRGGMGTVYLAAHPRLPRQVALKLLNRELFSDPEVRGRFEREADVSAHLDHPGIVSVLDRGVEDGLMWISMQYVDGTDASVFRGTPMAPARAIGIVAQTGEALDYAHERGVLHRDVKPANILLARARTGDRVLLTDFGIARLRGDARQLTRTGAFLATLAYASPEQLSGAAVDHRSDQYSLGCTLFTLLTGESPFPADNPGAVVAAHLSKPVPGVSASVPGLPPAIDVVIGRALAKNPDERFDSCAEFAHAAGAALMPGGPSPTGGSGPGSDAHAVVGHEDAARAGVPVEKLGRGAGPGEPAVEHGRGAGPGEPVVEHGRGAGSAGPAVGIGTVAGLGGTTPELGGYGMPIVPGRGAGQPYSPERQGDRAGSSPAMATVIATPPRSIPRQPVAGGPAVPQWGAPGYGHSRGPVAARKSVSSRWRVLAVSLIVLALIAGVGVVGVGAVYWKFVRPGRIAPPPVASWGEHRSILYDFSGALPADPTATGWLESKCHATGALVVQTGDPVPLRQITCTDSQGVTSWYTQYANSADADAYLTRHATEQPDTTRAAAVGANATITAWRPRAGEPFTLAARRAVDGVGQPVVVEVAAPGGSFESTQLGWYLWAPL
ncbi:serine/threonine-protein kinase [Nocardia asteroides]|uniref:serine/threonine-protein kinase n=1 Tax=Nocardia asteroides TaxID=1824 RepID=UPI003440FBDE